jgi:hypothetical protein
MFSFVEQTFGIQTVAIPVDFNDGPIAYEKIQPHLDDKEIGILGKLTSWYNMNWREWQKELWACHLSHLSIFCM